MAELTLERDSWYGWQMWPGYASVPYVSPILIHGVKRLHTGKRVLRLQFWNAFYAVGVQDFELDLRILKRSAKYLVAALEYGGGGGGDRCAVVSEISYSWIQQFCPELWSHHPLDRCSRTAQQSVAIYLQEVLNRS